MQLSLKHLKRIVQEVVDASDSNFRTIILDEDVHLVHRSERPISLADCDAESIRASKQSRRGKLCVSGLYAYLQSETDPNIERYGSHTIDLVIPAGSKILDTTLTAGATSRLDASNMDELRAMGYVALKGRDWVGPPEWVIISNEVLR
jgi:hypothetical protein